MRPLRAARSSSFVAVALISAVASGAFAFLSAVRRAERCARLRAVAARDFRMFFFADAIFGTKDLQKFSRSRDCRELLLYPARGSKSSWDITLCIWIPAFAGMSDPLPYALAHPWLA